MKTITKLLSTAILAAGLLSTPLAQASTCALAVAYGPNKESVGIVGDAHAIFMGEFELEETSDTNFMNAYRKTYDKNTTNQTVITEKVYVPLEDAPDECLLLRLNKKLTYKNSIVSGLRTETMFRTFDELMDTLTTGNSHTIENIQYNYIYFNGTLLGELDARKPKEVIKFFLADSSPLAKEVPQLFNPLREEKLKKIVATLSSFSQNSKKPIEQEIEETILNQTNKSNTLKTSPLYHALKSYEDRLRNFFELLRGILSTHSTTPIKDLIEYSLQHKKYHLAARILQEYVDILLSRLEDYGFLVELAKALENGNTPILVAGAGHCHKILLSLKKAGFQTAFVKTKNNCFAETFSEQELEEFFRTLQSQNKPIIASPTKSKL